MEFQRSHRVGDQIHKEISALLVKGLKDPRIGFVTITSVEVTPDLHLARVFFTVMGDEKARRESEAGLKNSTPYIRRELGKRLRMRYTPDLLFSYDTSVDYGSRIDKLLQDINDEQRHDQGDSGKD
ncbi:ribosome-binding factor A [Geoalkalibacter halelectricus]|uniref:Ribosome-binding factor A n=1 Tax=Geoalkalibacter halelectricus TaxID=2847045 RepID=A0ABY5ZVZ3_9BACT|nr:ribosome-binding factor A [Geoalkalibacter halelectricus]MDO3376682.1 ribosome-binding factor A [Geoalkalibacter halelectricus]UWZ81366.1 ribosome-binding factor A [Geoalkalibacter halelectricus]